MPHELDGGLLHVRRARVEEALGAGLGLEHPSHLVVDAEVEVLGVGQVPEKDVDRRALEVVGDEVLAVERRVAELLLEVLHLRARRRDARQQARRLEDVLRRVDGIGDAQHPLDAGDPAERVGDAGDLLDGGGREDVVGADPDHPDVVAAEGGADPRVVLDLGVARRQDALERALDPDAERVDAEHRGDEQVRRYEQDRVADEPPREAGHARRARKSPRPPRWG